MAGPVRPIFPFTALVGQDRMKLGLLLNAVNPKIGGILVRGEKGTAKSTAARALAALLPEEATVSECPFGCDPNRPATWCEDCHARADKGQMETYVRNVPLVELPVSATEDRVVGTLDIEHAVKEGQRRFEPGVLAAANRGILYVDEVNLLSDHLVDVLLDAAAMGVNYVEREGISFSHPAEFILIGTMNPEEGELRPQLLDRFALTVEVEGIHEPHLRAEVVRRRAAFELDPVGFNLLWEESVEEERERLRQARQLLQDVSLSESMLDLITRICSDLEVDGLRADIVMYKTAMTHAAYQGRTEVTPEDVRVAAMLALPHRRRRQPFDEASADPGDLERRVQAQISKTEAESAEESAAESPQPSSLSADEEKVGQGDVPRVDQPGAPFRVRKISADLTKPRERQRLGRRTSVTNTEPTGRYIRGAIPEERAHSLAFDATVRAAAVYQAERRAAAPDGRSLHLETWDIREKVRERKVSNLIVFLLDTSGSMGVENHMMMTKGAILSLLTDAYQKRDRVALITFHGSQAELVLEPTNSVQRAERILRQLPTGGRTPLADGLRIAGELLEKERQRDSGVLPLLIVVSDGRANVALHGSDPIDDVRRMSGKIRELNVNSMVVDTEAEHFRIGLASRLAEWLNGPCYRIEDLDAHATSQLVRQAIGR